MGSTCRRRSPASPANGRRRMADTVQTSYGQPLLMRTWREAAASMQSLPTGPDDGGGPGSDQVYETFWATGDYGFARLGYYRLRQSNELVEPQTLPEHVQYTGGTGTPTLLFVDIDIDRFYDAVFSQAQVRILVEGALWVDWFDWFTLVGGQIQRQPLSAGNAPSWPPPTGAWTFQIRVRWTAAPSWPYSYFPDLHVRRYSVATSRPR